MKYIILISFIASSIISKAQIPDAVYASNIKSVQLFAAGNQIGYPVLRLNGVDKVELDFDDLDANVKNYYYTFQLCDADWTPCMLSEFDFIRGFSNQRITIYRISSIAFTRYTHYQAFLPDKNCAPSKSGNYILKVFLNGDTSNLVFTKRMLVLDEKALVAAQIQQPFNQDIFQSHQKLLFKVNVNQSLSIVNQFQQIKIAVLQNNRWDNAITNVRPTFFNGNVLTYNNDNDFNFPAGKEWRWINLRSFRLQSDRVVKANYGKNFTEIFVKPDADRSHLQFNFFRDDNGGYSLETTENLNPLWETDYATVHFSFVPPGNAPFPGKDVFIFGALTNYNLDDSAKMTWNAEKGVYERSLFLKQGYYDYMYVTIDNIDKKRSASFQFTEGNYWESENDYTILVYYRALGGRSDELIGMQHINSLTGRRDIH